MIPFASAEVRGPKASMEAILILYGLLLLSLILGVLTRPLMRQRLSRIIRAQGVAGFLVSPLILIAASLIGSYRAEGEGTVSQYLVVYSLMLGVIGASLLIQVARFKRRFPQDWEAAARGEELPEGAASRLRKVGVTTGLIAIAPIVVIVSLPFAPFH